MAEARKKKKWKTRKRKGKRRVWKTRWVSTKSGSSKT